MPALIPYAGDALTDARRWVDLDPAERKRRAIEACRDRDFETLVQLAEAHTLLYGKKGARTSRNTQRAYRNAIRTLLREWAGVNMLHASVDEGAIFVRALEDAGKSPSTVTVTLAGARALYRALRWAKATTADPFQDVHPAPDPTSADQKRQPYSEADVARLLAAAGATERLFILLCSHSGLRISEALGLVKDDIDLSQGELHVRHGKGDKERWQSLSDVLAGALASAIEPLEVDSTVLRYRNGDQARRAIAKLCKQTGTKYRGAHSFRHYHGTRLYQQTQKVELVQKSLGHSSVDTAMIYIAYADRGAKDAVKSW